MGLKLPKIKIGKNSVVAQVARATTNPVRQINQTFGTKIPTSVKIGGTSIGTEIGIEGVLKQARASVRDIDKTRIQAKKDISNAERGEVGKWFFGATRSINNLNPIYIAEKTARGQSLSTTSQKALGGLMNLSTGGASNYLGQSSGVQKVLRDKNLSKNTLGLSENIAGLQRGTATLNNRGTISNDDRNNIFQGAVKAAAIATGVGAYSYFTAPAVAAPAATGGSLFPGGAVLSTDIAGAGLSSATVAEVTAAASTGGFWTGAASLIPSAESALLGYTLLTGRSAPTSIGDIFTGGDSGGNPGYDPGFWGRQPDFGGLPSYNVEAENPLANALASLLPTTDEGKMMLSIAVAAAVGYYLWSR